MDNHIFLYNKPVNLRTQNCDNNTGKDRHGSQIIQGKSIAAIRQLHDRRNNQEACQRTNRGIDLVQFVMFSQTVSDSQYYHDCNQIEGHILNRPNGGLKRCYRIRAHQLLHIRDVGQSQHQRTEHGKRYRNQERVLHSL